MKLEVVHTIAKSHGLHTGNCSKTELVKSIQAEEGNFNCYASACRGECDQAECMWREDCFDAAATA